MPSAVHTAFAFTLHPSLAHAHSVVGLLQDIELFCVLVETRHLTICLLLIFVCFVEISVHFQFIYD